MATSNGNAALATRPAEGRDVDTSIVERVLLAGDLSKLAANERVAYYDAVCRSVGLNPLTQPFAYISLNGKLTLYALKNATDQLRSLYGVSVVATTRQNFDGVHVVTARVRTKDGREDEDIGAVALGSLKGEALANALMKATTKAKRRATLSICGLSFLDESEVDSIPDARRVTVTQDGEILDAPKTLPKVAPPPPPSDHAALVRDFEAQIGAVVSGNGTLRDLKHVGIAIAKSGLDETAREHLEGVYELAIEAIKAREGNHG